ncbi:unnamed protein product [Camellia sinensis]
MKKEEYEEYGLESLLEELVLFHLDLFSWTTHS